MTIIGIDNGVSGGLASLTEDGDIINRIAMPIQASKRGQEIDVIAVWWWLKEQGESLGVAIEEPAGSRFPTMATSMSGSFHSLRTILVLKKVTFHRITPQSWQAKIIPDCAKGMTKPRALAKARELWPKENFLETEKCKKPHDGIIDALLIAQYARLHLF